MQLHSLEINARDQNRRIYFTAPVTVISGPNGCGKSTAVASVELALKGTVTVDGEPVKKPADVFSYLSSGAPVGVTAAFHGCSITRSLTATATGATQTLHFSGAPGAKGDVAQGAIIATIGDVARVDVNALLSKGPTERRATILGLCRAFAKPWTMDELRDGYEGAGGTSFAFLPDRNAGLLASIEAHAAAAKQAVLDTDKEIKRLQAAIDAHQGGASAQAVAGDPESLGARIEALNAEIQRLSGDAASIDSASREDAAISAALDRLAGLPHPERAQAEVDAVQARIGAMKATLAALLASPLVAPEPPAELSDLREQLREQERIVARAVADHDAVHAFAENLRAVINGVHAHRDCPTCQRPMNESARTGIVAALRNFEAQMREATAQADAATDTADVLRADIEELRVDHDRVMGAHDAAVIAQRDTLGHLNADLAREASNLRAAQDMLKRAQSAGPERAHLQKQRAALNTGDADLLRTQIEAARAERADLTRRRDAVIADATRVQTYRLQVVERDEKAAASPAMKQNAKAWAVLVNEVAESAMKPFMDACNAALPSGWSMAFDLDVADFLVTRGGLTVAFSALSKAERLIGLAGMVAGLAKTSGNAWKAVVLDDCDGIMDGGWGLADWPVGLFAPFVERLCDAARLGLVDQVILSTSRRLVGRERESIDAAGAQVLELGGPYPEPTPDDSLPWGGPEAEPPEDAKGRARSIREALKGTSADAMAFMYEHVVGTPPRSTAATVRRVVTERLTDDDEPLESVLGLIAEAARRHPPTPRSPRAA